VNNGRSLTSEHRRHDRLLVTRFAMDDAYPSERAEAQALLESCVDCASLAADIRLVATSVSRLPLPARPRDFSITAEQAERLRGSRLTRWLRSLGTPGWAALRPVAGVALSIGLVMAVVGAALPRMETATLFSAAPATGTSEPAVAPAPAGTFAPMEVDTPPQGGPNRNGVGDVTSQATPEPIGNSLDEAYLRASPAPGADDGYQAGELQVPTDPTRGLLIYIGLAIATLSFGLLALAFVARRYFADPLLR
jgi:hypothetical protein